MVQTLRENQKRGRGRPPSGWIEDAMRATGWSRRAVQLSAERGEKIGSENLALMRGSVLDKGSYLDSIKNLSRDEQRAKILYDLEHGLPKRPKSNLTPLQKAWLDADEDERESFLGWITTID